jgi:hypothetical protein
MVELQHEQVAQTAVFAAERAQSVPHQLQVPPLTREEVFVPIEGPRIGSPGASAPRSPTPMAVDADHLTECDLRFQALDRPARRNEHTDGRLLLLYVVELENQEVCFGAVNAGVPSEIVVDEALGGDLPTQVSGR